MAEKSKDETTNAGAPPAPEPTEITDDDLKSVSGGLGQPQPMKLHGSDFNAAKDPSK